MPSLADIPLEVLIDNLLPHVPLKDILSLTVASKDFAALCSDDTFWKRKLQKDYNFSDASSARTKGYRFIYKGVHNAKVYVWGSTGEGRLGLGKIPNPGGILNGSRPYPTRLKVPGPRIVELAAGGWSFHALDSEGCVHVWGQLDGSMLGGLHGDPFSQPTKRAAFPTKLMLPEKISKIGCGRAHATALSSMDRVWEFTSWGRPYVLTTPLLSTSSNFSTPRQVECGWSFSAVLTHGGEVYFWLPFEGEFADISRVHDEQTNGQGQDAVEDHNDVVLCRPWEINADPKQITGFRSALPKLRGEEQSSGDRIVKIAAGDEFLIGLTESGHVLKVDRLGPHRWEYLSRFSEVEHVRAHPTFSPGDEDDGRKAPDAPETLHITHISAHFRTFFAYSTGSSSIVLRGSDETSPDSEPHIPHSLQNIDVISVVLGDYHFGALTSTGKLLTWGAYSSGALGLGDPTQVPIGIPGGYEADDRRVRAKRFRIIPPDVTEPTEVKFGTKDGSKGRESFVFGATASGWHTGALVIDLEDAEEDEDEDGTETEDPHVPGAFESTTLPGQPWAGHIPFRIGLAGARGRGRGRGRGGA